jgi:hypothetical protein
MLTMQKVRSSRKFYSSRRLFKKAALLPSGTLSPLRFTPCRIRHGVNAAEMVRRLYLERTKLANFFNSLLLVHRAGARPTGITATAARAGTG